MTKFDVLRHCRLFELLSDEELSTVNEKVEEHYYRKGDYVTREGAWGDSMYIIGQGEVKVSRKLSVESTWDITSLRHGDFFGEVALIDGSPRTATVMALTNVTVLELFGRDFKMLISGGTTLANKLMESLLKVLVVRMRNTDSLVTSVMTENLRGRVHHEITLREAVSSLMIGRTK
jgi:CRP/FNR family transcriptional regulator, cyclic AMP receptor protein